jgi:hypothetical protein
MAIVWPGRSQVKQFVHWDQSVETLLAKDNQLFRFGWRIGGRSSHGIKPKIESP